MRHIIRTSHPLINEIKNIRDKKAVRYELKQVFVEGAKLVEELALKEKIKIIFLEEGRELLPIYSKAEEIVIVSKEVMAKISSLESPDGVAALIAMPAFGELDPSAPLIVLDRVADPGNMGTILRTALALGWKGVFILEGSCDPFNDKALRAARGATFTLPLCLTNWDRLADFVEANSYSCLGADIAGLPLKEVERPKKPLLFLGNEANGLSDDAKRFCERITIPLQGGVESLNVATAAAILMYHFLPDKLQIDASQRLLIP